ncbi:MAG: histidine kinase [Lutibacter sp.]|nr:histidine kinase [Lutibacter sp.]
MKLKFLFVFIISFGIGYAQKISYSDSLQNNLKNLSKPQQLKQILGIPYDKFIGNIAASEKLAHKAIELAKELNDRESLAEANLLMSQIYNYKDKREKKLVFNLNAIRIYEEIGKLEKAGYAYGELGFSIKREDLKSALHYMRKGLKIIENIKTAKKADATFDNYGILQGMLKNYDSAIYYHKKSLQIKKQNNDSIGIPYGYVHLATVNIYLNNFSIAKKYIDSSQIIRLKRKDIYGITDNYVYYGDLYFAEKKYAQAIENFKKGYHLSIKNNFSSLQKYCADYLTKSYLELGDFKNAFTYNKIFQTLKDSTINTETNSRVASLQIEFETEKKEKEISQQKELLLARELELKNKNLFTLFLGSGLLVLGIVLFGLYKRQQHKKREYQNMLALKEAQTLGKLQDQRLRISRDLHDNIGSQLTFIISSIDNLKYLERNLNTVLQNKLTEINSFAGNTISQLRDTIWAMNKNEISYEDFQGRILSFMEKAKLISNNCHFSLNSTIKTPIIFSSIKGINLFRIIQEAINNAIKYAKASEISVFIEENNQDIIIKIFDNGIGFDLNSIELGNGLDNMQKRTDEINGKITINSKIDLGTQIEIICAKNQTNDVWHFNA